MEVLRILPQNNRIEMHLRHFDGSLNRVWEGRTRPWSLSQCNAMDSLRCSMEQALGMVSTSLIARLRGFLHLQETSFIRASRFALKCICARRRTDRCVFVNSIHARRSGASSYSVRNARIGSMREARRAGQ